MHCVFDVQATKGTPKPKVCRTPQEMAEEVKKSMKSVCAVSESMQSLWGAHHVRQCAWLMRLSGNGASSAYGMSLWHPNPRVAVINTEPQLHLGNLQAHTRGTSLQCRLIPHRVLWTPGDRGIEI